MKRGDGAELNVQISTKLNRSHLQVVKAALILPCLGRTELDMQRSGNQKITVEDTFSMVHASTGMNEPVSPLCLSEIDIVARMADATVGSDRVDWLALRDDYGRIRDLIEETIAGFADFNAASRSRGFHLDNRALLRWNTASGSAEFVRAVCRNPSCPSAPATPSRWWISRAAAAEPALTISTTPPSTAWMTAIAASRASATWSS
jgi:hypothetical protein